MGYKKKSNRELRTFGDEELESATSGFSPSALLGRGSHASVYLASLDGGRLLAAAKLPSPSTSPLFAHREIALLSSLPPSPLLVNLLGSSPSSSVAVFDLMPRGSLHHLLRGGGCGVPPPFSRRLSLALCSALALASLHSFDPPVVHRDFKPENILLDSQGLPRLADFGLAVRIAGELPPPAGTLGYLDPAYLSPGDLSKKTDVYSFGVVLLELISGRKAIDVDHSPPCLVDWAVQLVDSKRFEEVWDWKAPPVSVREEAAARELLELAMSCVASDQESRPEMEEVVERLREARSRARPGWRAVGRLVRRWKLSGRTGKVADVAV